MKYFKIMLLFFFCSALLFAGVRVSAEEQRVNSDGIALGDNIVIASSLSRFETVSRDSAVKIETDTGYGSGTYFKIEKKHVILTAAHVIQGSEWVTVIGRDDEKIKAKPIFIDRDNDFAVLSLENTLKTRKFSSFKPSKEKIENTIGKKIFYTGFPNSHDLLTLRGSISGQESGFLILQSYAWSGASGSCVFDEWGNLVGVLTGVGVGSFSGEYHLIPAVVWIVPIQNIDIQMLKSVIKERAAL